MKPIPVSVLAAVAAAGWAAAWVGTSGWLTAQWLGTGILVLVVLLWWLFRTQSAGAVALVGVGFVVVALLAGARTWQQQSSLPAQWAQQHRTATLSIKLATEPRLVAGDTAMLIQGKVTEIAVPGHRLRTNQPIVAFARNTAEVNQLQFNPAPPTRSAVGYPLENQEIGRHWWLACRKWVTRYHHPGWATE